MYKGNIEFTYHGYVSVENLYGGGFHSYWYYGNCPILLLREFYSYKDFNRILDWKLSRVNNYDRRKDKR